MKRLIKNRIVLVLCCILVSLIICFGLTPMFNNALKSKVTIVRVASEIRKGEQITANMLTSVEVGGYHLPSNVVYEPEQIIGKYANADFSRGDYILESKLIDTPMLKNEYLRKLNGENRAISISIKSFAAGLSGKLEPGDIVSLIAGDMGERRETVILPELQYVQIIATTTSDGIDNHVQEAGAGEELPLASSITVLAAPEQARLLAELEQNGSIHVALVYRGNSDQAQLFLDEQLLVLETLSAERTEEAGTAEDTEHTEENGTMEEPEEADEGEN